MSELHPLLSSRFGGGTDALLLVVEPGIIEAANAAAERLFRYKPRGLDGEAIECLVPESVREHHPGLVSSFFADPEVRHLGTRSLTAVRSDGSEFRADILLFPFTRSGKTVVLVGVVDLTIQTAVEEAKDGIQSMLNQVESEKGSMSPDEYRRLVRQLGDLSLQALSESAESRRGRDDFLLGFIASQKASDEEHFDRLFESMPLPMWESDAHKLVPWFQALRREGVQDLGAHFEAKPESLDRAISSMSITRLNRTAARIARAEGDLSQIGPIDPATIGSLTRRMIREQLISQFQGKSYLDVEIAGDEPGSDERDLRMVAWTRFGDDGQLDLSSVFTTVFNLQPQNRLSFERRIALEQFEQVFDNAAAGITLLDLEDGVFTRANRAFTDMLGYPEGGLDGVNLSEITPSGALMNLDEYIRPSSRDERDVTTFDRPYLHRDGGIRWGRVSIRSPGDDGDELMRSIAVITDITNLRAEQHARSRTDEKFRLAIAHSPIGIAICTLRDDGHSWIGDGNPALARLFDRTLESIVGSKVRDLVHVDDYAEMRDALAASFVDSTPSESMTRRCARHDGSTLWARISVAPLPEDSRHMKRSILMFEDLAEYDAAHRRISQLAESLERRNADLQTFVWTAAHDLGEPLRKIRVFGERLADTAGEGLDDRSRDYLERMTTAAERMQDLIDGLLEYSRVTTRAQPFELVDLGEVARDVVSDLEVTIAEVGATVEIGSLPTVMGEPTQLRQLIQNLIVNSVKFHSSERLPVVIVSGRSDDDVAEFSVSDNGMGFEPDQSKHIFGLFERLHGRGEIPGNGMGLAIVDKVVEHHGGSISAKSTPGNGATFTVRLPAFHPGDGGEHA